MARRKIRHGGQLVCDMPGCSSTFVTYSYAFLVRRQARNAGWGRDRGSMVNDADGHALASKGRKVDLCPEHRRHKAA